MSLWSSVSQIFWPSSVKAAEGQYHPGPYNLPISGGYLSADAGQYLNWWQMGYDLQGSSTTAMVEACVSAYAQTIAMCPGDHWKRTPKAGRTRVSSSALSRILRVPNDYQSASDFLLNLVRNLYLTGNAYAIALRNSRFEIDELHLMSSLRSHPQLAPSGEIFYSLGGNNILEMRLTGQSESVLTVPARDVLHVRLNTPFHPLIGESPIRAAAIDAAASGAMTAQQFAFYMNQARPSYVLQTDERLTRETIDMLREKWNEQSRGMNQGGTPILTAGLKPLPLTMTAQDAQLVEMMRMSDEHIALAFRIPLQILGIGTGKGAMGPTEALMAQWIAQGLGFALNHIEEAIDRLFGLRGQPDEYTEFSTAVLQRSSMKDRIAALAQGVQGGIYAPNEARAVEELPEVEYGDEPRVQQQVVPLSAAKAIPATPPSPGPPAPPPAPADKPPPPAEPGSKKDFDANELRSRFRSSHAAHVDRAA
jgi:HK97 family phage portal protein